jgi:hypothetical protein
VCADALVAARKQYKLKISVVGDEGIAEYVRVSGNVKLPGEKKLRFFKRLVPGTVLRLNTYRRAQRADIAGRKGDGVISSEAIVLFRGLDGAEILFDEIPARNFYLPEDLAAAGESDSQSGDICLPRRRDISELGIYGVCSGSHGHLSALSRTDAYPVSVNGAVVEMPEFEFVARGLRNLGIDFNGELLAQGRIFPKTVK